MHVLLIRIGRIISAYCNDRMFAVELVGAVGNLFGDSFTPKFSNVPKVLRQGSFVAKMHNLRWTEPRFFDNREDEVALQHAIARYHAFVHSCVSTPDFLTSLRIHRFLDLMASSPESFFVPTLDIDLAWHTHQLMADQYNADCTKYVRRYIDQWADVWP